MTATDPAAAAAQPATPGQALRMAAGRGDHYVDPADLRRWADELDATPATYALPPEPPESTRLWTRDGTPVAASRSHGDDPHLWWDVEGHGIHRWPGVLDEFGPLSTAPPAGTEAQ